MPSKEKEILRLLETYFSLLHGQLEDLLYRVKIAETALQANPVFLAAYNQAVKDTHRPMLPALPRQFSAIQQAIQRLPD